VLERKSISLILEIFAVPRMVKSVRLFVGVSDSRPDFILRPACMEFMVFTVESEAVPLRFLGYLPIIIIPKFFHTRISLTCGPGSVVGIATAYGLDGPEIESRWGARFSAHVRTGLEDHSPSCVMGTGSFSGVMCGRGVTLTPHPLIVPRSKIE